MSEDRMTPLNLAIVSQSDTAGGAEAHTAALGDGLSRRGHAVTLYGKCPGWERTGLPRHDIGLGPKWSRATLPYAFLRVPVERQRVQAVPDASVYYMQFKREQISLTRTLSRKAPVVWTEHGRWMGGAVGRVLARGYEQAAKHVTTVVCVSDDVAADLAPMVGRDKLAVIPNAIDTGAFTPPAAPKRSELRARLLPDRFQDRTVAILASRLHSAKQHDRAIAAAERAGVALVIAGDGPDRPRLEELARGKDVHFLGFRDDIADLLAASDLYLFCGAETDGGSAYAVLEAAACGLPVVSFDGDPSSDLAPRLGGVKLAEPGQLTPTVLRRVLDATGTGVEYVRKHHSREAWLDAFEATLREAAR
jgi:glycosyltransferase involved in cell wall biosynthesis